MAVSVRDSILLSTKNAMGIVPEYDGFNDQLIMLINASFATLWQLGIGPEDGFDIEDAEPTWSDYIGNSKILKLIIQYVHIDVRLQFDPPSNSFAVQSIKDKLQELIFRIQVLYEQGYTKQGEQ